jgi:hypothetical protein
MRPAPAGANQLAGHHFQPLQPDKPLPDCGRRHSQVGTDFLDSASTNLVEPLQELTITGFDGSFHRFTGLLKGVQAFEF